MRDRARDKRVVCSQLRIGQWEADYVDYDELETSEPAHLVEATWLTDRVRLVVVALAYGWRSRRPSMSSVRNPSHSCLIAPYLRLVGSSGRLVVSPSCRV